MKILLLNTFDIEGGAALAAFRLHKGLQNIEIDSRMLVQFKTSGDPTVVSPISKCAKGFSLLRPTLDELPLKFYSKWDGTIFSLACLPEKIAGKCAMINPDIIHLNWIGAGFLRIETLLKLHKPLVWTLHDMWAFTGGCHYSIGCERYKKSCGACPQLKSKKLNDLSNWVWKRKKKAWQCLDMVIVTPSRWLSECARSSSLLQNHRIEVIPNGLDIKRYKPFNKKLAREILDLPYNRKLILFGAMFACSNKHKGFQFLQPALQNLAQNGWADQAELIIFGASKPPDPPDFGLNARYLGRLHDDVSLALLYNAADVFLLPSIQDNLPNTIMESLACGTPVVAFNVGGIPELVEHQINGYVAKAMDIKELTKGIHWVLSDPKRHTQLGKMARKKAIKEYVLELQAQRYRDLYEDILRLK